MQQTFIHTKETDETEIVCVVHASPRAKVEWFKNGQKMGVLTVTLTLEEAPANSVPAAAVIRRVQALIGITGRKARVGGFLSRM